MAGSILLSPAPYHIISYGTLLGTTFFHSFINGFTQIKVLPRSQFAAVQNKLFPVYFSMQSVIPVILALTYPGGGPYGTRAGIVGLLDPTNRWTFVVPLVAMAATGLANLLILLPATQKCMEARKAQEEKDGKKSYDSPPHSEEMMALKKQFGKLHGISSLLNLTTYVATLVYGVSLSARLQ